MQKCNFIKLVLIVVCILPCKAWNTQSFINCQAEQIRGLLNNITNTFDKEIGNKFAKQDCYLKQSKMYLEQKKFDNLLYYSGHYFNQIGNPKQCENAYFILDSENKIVFSYFLLLLTKKLKEDSDIFEDQLNLFLSLKKSNLGLCLLENCTESMTMIFNHKDNEKFFEYFNEVYDIEDMQFYHLDHKEKFSLKGKIVFFIIMGYLLIRIILSMLTIFLVRNDEDESVLNARKGFLDNDESIIEKYFNNKKGGNKSVDLNLFNQSGNQFEEKEEDGNEEQIKKEAKSKGKIEGSNNNNNSKKKISDDEEEDEEEEEEENNESKISSNSLFERKGDISDIQNLEKFINPANKLINNPVPIPQNIAPKENQVEQKEIENNEAKPQTKNKIRLFLSSFNDKVLVNITVKILISKKSYLYKSKSLEMLKGLRVFIVLFLTLDRVYHLIYNSPSNLPATVDFFDSFYFGLIKFSSYASYSWIFLDGLIFTYKLLNHVRNNQSLSNFLNFYFRIIPKVLVFIVIFYCVYYVGNDIALLFNKTVIFDQMFTNDLGKKHCVVNPLLIFIPFYLGYSTYDDVQYDSCYHFSYLFINELLCVTVLLFLIYFLYKFKSIYCDIIITIIIGLNILFSYFSYGFFTKGKYSSKYILLYIIGETSNITRPHLMLNIFFLGVICGVVYYYYVQSMNQIESYLKKNYLPFSYAEKIMHFYIHQNLFIKILIIFLSISIIIILSILYVILKNSNLNEEHKFLFNFNVGFKLIYVYEVPIFTFFFAILVLYLLFSNDKSRFRGFFGSSVFFCFDRVSFVYVCLLEYMITFVYAMFDVNGIYWDYLYLWYITSFIFALLSLISVAIAVFIELPFKFGVVYLLRGAESKKSNFY